MKPKGICLGFLLYVHVLASMRLLSVLQGQLDTKSKSEGGTPRSSTPQKWAGSEGMSSDEAQTDEEVGGDKIVPIVRGSRRSLRKKKFNLTTQPSSDELVCATLSSSLPLFLLPSLPPSLPPPSLLPPSLPPSLPLSS